MNFQDLSGRVRGVFKPRERELPAPAPPEGAAPGQQQAPVTIIMPGQQGRKISTPVVVIGVCLVAFALYFAGHSSAKVDTPASHGNNPTPTSAANIKDWNKPVATSPVIVETRSPAQQAEDAYQKSQAEQLAMMQRSGQYIPGRFRLALLAAPRAQPRSLPRSSSRRTGAKRTKNPFMPRT